MRRSKLQVYMEVLDTLVFHGPMRMTRITYKAKVNCSLLKPDRVVVTAGRMRLMPPQVFADLKQLMKKVMAEDWVALAQRIPNLESK